MKNHFRRVLCALLALALCCALLGGAVGGSVKLVLRRLPEEE